MGLRYSWRTRHATDAELYHAPQGAKAEAFERLRELTQDGRLPGDQIGAYTALADAETEAEIAALLEEAVARALPSPFPAEATVAVAHESWDCPADWQPAHLVRLDATDATLRFDFTRIRIPARGLTLDCAGARDSRIEIRVFNDTRIDTSELGADAAAVRVRGRYYGQTGSLVTLTGRLSGSEVHVDRI